MTATETLHDAKDEVARKAGEYASEAKAALFEQAEGTQRDISSNMKAFGGALRAASEHLGEFGSTCRIEICARCRWRIGAAVCRR